MTSADFPARAIAESGQIRMGLAFAKMLNIPPVGSARRNPWTFVRKILSGDSVVKHSGADRSPENPLDSHISALLARLVLLIRIHDVFLEDRNYHYGSVYHNHGLVDHDIRTIQDSVVEGVINIDRLLHLMKESSQSEASIVTQDDLKEAYNNVTAALRSAGKLLRQDHGAGFETLVAHALSSLPDSPNPDPFSRTDIYRAPRLYTDSQITIHDPRRDRLRKVIEAHGQSKVVSMIIEIGKNLAGRPSRVKSGREIWADMLKPRR